MAAWLRRSAVVIHEQRTWLTELDAAIGDGDHGINLDRGLSLVASRLESGQLTDERGADLLEAAGRTILGTVGGASGALYGRALVRAGESLAAAGTVASSGSEALSPSGSDTGWVSDHAADPVARAAAAMSAAAKSIAGLGRSAAGDKTMLDALLPAIAALEAAGGEGQPLPAALAAAARAAEEGAQATVSLLARRGRASYLGSRSIGHLDPGAASTALFLAVLAEVAAETCAWP